VHPFFWDPARRLTFLQDASDRFEIMCRDPRDPNLVALETDAINIVGNDWHTRLDKVFIENLGKFRKYDGRSVQDLLRALRNKVRIFFLSFFFFCWWAGMLTGLCRSITIRIYQTM
jgi:serine/threonine-protein kinase/endoribonuclease IRE1